MNLASLMRKGTMPRDSLSCILASAQRLQIRTVSRIR